MKYAWNYTVRGIVTWLAHSQPDANVHEDPSTFLDELIMSMKNGCVESPVFPADDPRGVIEYDPPSSRVVPAFGFSSEHGGWHLCPVYRVATYFYENHATQEQREAWNDYQWGIHDRN